VDEQGNTIRLGINGGMLKKQSPEHKFTYYINVESLEGCSKKVKQSADGILVSDRYPENRLVGARQRSRRQPLRNLPRNAAVTMKTFGRG
jgi:hypothetical protein